MKVTIEILEELGFELKESKWIHKTNNKYDGLFIYENNLPEKLCDLVRIMTGTAFKKGKEAK